MHCEQAGRARSHFGRVSHQWQCSSPTNAGGSITLILRRLHVEHARLLGRPAWADLCGTDCILMCGMALTLVVGVGSDSDHDSLAAQTRFEIAYCNIHSPTWSPKVEDGRKTKMYLHCRHCNRCSILTAHDPCPIIVAKPRTYSIPGPTREWNIPGNSRESTTSEA